MYLVSDLFAPTPDLCPAERRHRRDHRLQESKASSFPRPICDVRNRQPPTANVNASTLTPSHASLPPFIIHSTLDPGQARNSSAEGNPAAETGLARPPKRGSPPSSRSSRYTQAGGCGNARVRARPEGGDLDSGAPEERVPYQTIFGGAWAARCARARALRISIDLSRRAPSSPTAAPLPQDLRPQASGSSSRAAGCSRT
ncbi:hypothetical protein LXA43DRAFT_85784 [Ganoderma leucocontextum]|nr:hypothetical protein LXA43DRAFT_85784 [Ganoderma leucocontextum]